MVNYNKNHIYKFRRFFSFPIIYKNWYLGKKLALELFANLWSIYQQ